MTHESSLEYRTRCTYKRCRILASANRVVNTDGSHAMRAFWNVCPASLSLCQACRSIGRHGEHAGAKKSLYRQITDCAYRGSTQVCTQTKEEHQRCGGRCIEAVFDKGVIRWRNGIHLMRRLFSNTCMTGLLNANWHKHMSCWCRAGECRSQEE